MTEPTPVEAAVTAEKAGTAFNAIWAMIIILVVVVAMFFVSIIYTNHVNDISNERNELSIAKTLKNQQNFCALIHTLDSAYQSQPPTTPTGKTVALEMHQLVHDLGCDPQ